MTQTQRTPGPWAGWVKKGGGHTYTLVSPDGSIRLRYRTDGWGYSGRKARQMLSTKPWQVTVNGRSLYDKAERLRLFATPETALAAARAAIAKARGEG